ncbi:MAG: hypothetical protein ACI9F9_001802 [Candidatus Paceibacteria bacterium]|jgi:hypothetical protein
MRHHHVILALASTSLTLFAGACNETNLVGAQFVSNPVTDVEGDTQYTYTPIVAGSFPPDTIFTLLAGPAGMVAAADGEVTWNPTFADLGVHAVELQVTDGEVLAVQAWDVSVHQNLLFGVSYSPLGHTGSTVTQDEDDFATEHATFGRLVGYSGSWRDSLSSAGTIPIFASDAMDEAVSRGFETVIGFQWADDSGNPDLLSDGDGADNSWSNQETRDEFLMTVEGFALMYQPRYLFLGDEVNTWALTHPGDWADWLTELEDCANAIVAVSPLTCVFTTFQLEHMKGLGSGTQGWMDAPQWNLVDDLEAGGFLHGVGFTSYPHFEYAAPGAMPMGYYTEIAAHWTGQSYFTEIGWAGAANAPYPGSPTDQDAFVGQFISQTEGMPVEMALWLYLHDFDGQGATPAFTDMGLRSNDGMVIRPAEATWSAAVLLRERP